MDRKLLVIDTSYTYDHIRERQLEDSVTCRDLGGYFSHVWTVHPLASLVSDGGHKFGPPETHRLADAHTFIDGKIGRFAQLGRIAPLNLLAGQSELLFDIVSLVKRERISAVRAADPLYNGLMGLFVARLCNIPLVIRVNANYEKIYANTGLPLMPRVFRTPDVERKVFRFVLSHADLVAAVNEDNLDFAIASGARPERSTIWRYGNLIDKRHVAAPETRDRSWAPLEEFWPAPTPFLVAINRLVPMKHPADPIRTFAELARRGHPDLKLVMVGDGDMRGELEALCKELGVDGRVAFAGNRGQDWLSRVIPLATAVLSPITGRALSECAFGAAPIVAYDLDWQGELIETGKTGELTPAHDPIKMADGVERFLADPAYARRMGDAVRKRAFEMLDPATLDEHERKTYEALFARFRAGSPSAWGWDRRRRQRHAA